MKDAQQRNIATFAAQQNAQILSNAKQSLNAGSGTYLEEIGDTYIDLLGDFS